MKKINIRKFYYQLTHRYATRENIIIATAFVVAASWAWGSIGMMQRNYRLQQEVDGKLRQEQLVELQVRSAELEQRYYQSEEYQELEARRRMGLAHSGEKVLILPPNSAQAAQLDAQPATTVSPQVGEASNLQQWANFLLGGTRERLQD